MLIRSQVDAFIHDFLNGEANIDLDGNRIFEGALIGVSNGNDPIYEFLKQDIGEQYWTPVEAFKIGFPELDVDPSELSVISWILPFTEKTKLSQYDKQFPSKNWVHGRLDGEIFNEKLRIHLVNSLNNCEVMAVAPSSMKQWDNFKSDRYGYASKWSERHTAYISGLGTFGLCDGLITKVGKAHRCGSIIVLGNIDATIREYSNHHEYCLFYTSGTCKKCIERCPTGAIFEDGHNKVLCRQYQREYIKEYVKEEYKLESTCC